MRGSRSTGVGVQLATENVRVDEHGTGACPCHRGLDLEALRGAIREEYALVAVEPGRGFHFHTGRPLARLVGYDDSWLDGSVGRLTTPGRYCRFSPGERATSPESHPPRAAPAHRPR